MAGLAFTASAQKTEKQVATLQHGDKTSVFYGANAFVQAYDAAADTLDVITLSSGEFYTPTSISKSIAIYGAGFENDTVIGIPRTYLRGNLSLIPADAQDEDGNTIKGGKHVNGVHIEGVYVNGSIYIESNNNIPIHHLSVVKCYVGAYLRFGVDSYDCSIRQSYLSYTPFTPISHISKAYNLLVSNSYIDKNTDLYQYPFDDSSTILINHCILRRLSSGKWGRCYCTNSIIYEKSLPDGIEGSNNIFISSSTASSTNGGTWFGMSNQEVWATEGEDGSYAYYKSFALKDPTSYVGTDGTEIGLHGGAYAWNKIPSIPRITECTIDTENVSDGTLKVSIKAEAQTKE